LGGVEKTVQGGPANGPDNVSIGSRIQTITFSVEGENPEPSRVADQGLLAMVEGWRDFLTANLAALFECKGTVHGQPNKFSDTAPSSLIYDVSDLVTQAPNTILAIPRKCSCDILLVEGPASWEDNSSRLLPYHYDIYAKVIGFGRSS